MDTVDQIIHAKWIFTAEESNALLEDHCLVIKKDKIHAIVPSKEVAKNYKSKKKSHYNDHLIMPGFINSHTHSAMTLFRGLADDLELMDWLNNHIWPAETKWVSAEMVGHGSVLAMAEMIRSGTVCFNDMYFFPEVTAKVVDEVGMRAHLGMTVIGVPTAWAKTPKEYFEKGIAFYHHYKHHPRITPTLAPHSTYSVRVNDLIKVKELSDQFKLRINIHLQEDPAEIRLSLEKYQKRPLQRLDEIGLLSNRVIAIHMTQVVDEDMELLLKYKPSIVHCPESNMKLASGTCPVERLTQRGLNIALGTDGAASNNDLDMIGEMRAAALLGKIAANDPKAMKAEQVLRMATINGAKALGIDNITGSLRPGKSADFIAITLAEIETQPMYHPLSQTVYAASRNQVSDVWVAGKQLMKSRKLQTVDEKELLKKAQSWRNKIKK